MILAIFLCSAKRTFAQNTEKSKDKVTELKEIAIKYKKPVLERKPDRIIVNVDALLSNTGGNALEVLEQVPGIVVNNDQLVLKGKLNVLVFIDNKPTYLQGSDLADYLKSLPVGLLDKIEIMTNPPAQYEASGNAGIINIRLKKGKAAGFNGNLLTENTHGKYSRISQIGHFNYRNDQFNLYGNLNNYNGSGIAEVNSSRVYPKRNDNALQSILQHSSIKSPSQRVMGRIGLDLYLNPKTTAGLAIGHTYRDLKEHNSINSRQLYGGQTEDTLISADNENRSRVNNTTINISFQHQYDTVGRILTADFDLINYAMNHNLVNRSIKTTEQNQLINTTQEDFEGKLPSRIRIYSGKSDYVLPFSKDSKIEMGVKSSLLQNTSTSFYSTKIDRVPLIAYDNAGQFNYTEHIQAAYLNYNGNYRQFTFQLGLRAENTRSKGEQKNFTAGIDSAFRRHYTDLFPTAFFSLKIGEKGESLLNLSFGKRIERPNYQNLNPFAAPRDRYNYDIGNPYLKPQFSYNCEASYLFRKLFTISFFYNHLKDGIDETIVVKEDVFYHLLDNIGMKDISGFSIDGSITIAGWWTLNPSLLFTHTRYQTIFDDQLLKAKGGNWSISVGQQFNLSGGWNAEILGNYTSAQVYAQYTQKASWYIHAGISKKMWNNKATIKLNARDVFYTRVDLQDFKALKGISGFSSRKWDTRNVTLALNYRFNLGKPSSMSRKPDKSQESKRLGEL